MLRIKLFVKLYRQSSEFKNLNTFTWDRSSDNKIPGIRKSEYLDISNFKIWYEIYV